MCQIVGVTFFTSQAIKADKDFDTDLLDIIHTFFDVSWKIFIALSLHVIKGLSCHIGLPRNTKCSKSTTYLVVPNSGGYTVSEQLPVNLLLTYESLPIYMKNIAAQ